MSENIQDIKRVHPWKMAEEWARKPVKTFNVQPIPVHPFRVTEMTTNKQSHPFRLAEWATGGGN